MNVGVVLATCSAGDSGCARDPMLLRLLSSLPCCYTTTNAVLMVVETNYKPLWRSGLSTQFLNADPA